MIQIMLNILGTFGCDQKSKGQYVVRMNTKGRMDSDDFFDYIQTIIMPSYPH